MTKNRRRENIPDREQAKRSTNGRGEHIKSRDSSQRENGYSHFRPRPDADGIAAERKTQDAKQTTTRRRRKRKKRKEKKRSRGRTSWSAVALLATVATLATVLLTTVTSLTTLSTAVAA
jgi:hypothetical protein